MNLKNLVTCAALAATTALGNHANAHQNSKEGELGGVLVDGKKECYVDQPSFAEIVARKNDKTKPTYLICWGGSGPDPDLDPDVTPGIDPDVDAVVSKIKAQQDDTCKMYFDKLGEDKVIYAITQLAQKNPNACEEISKLPTFRPFFLFLNSIDVYNYPNWDKVVWDKNSTFSDKLFSCNDVIYVDAPKVKNGDVIIIPNTWFPNLPGYVYNIPTMEKGETYSFTVRTEDWEKEVPFSWGWNSKKDRPEVSENAKVVVRDNKVFYSPEPVLKVWDIVWVCPAEHEPVKYEVTIENMNSILEQINYRVFTGYPNFTIEKPEIESIEVNESRKWNLQDTICKYSGYSMNEFISKFQDATDRKDRSEKDRLRLSCRDALLWMSLPLTIKDNNWNEIPVTRIVAKSENNVFSCIFYDASGVFSVTISFSMEQYEDPIEEWQKRLDAAKFDPNNLLDTTKIKETRKWFEGLSPEQKSKLDPQKLVQAEDDRAAYRKEITRGEKQAAIEDSWKDWASLDIEVLRDLIPTRREGVSNYFQLYGHDASIDQTNLDKAIKRLTDHDRETLKNTVQSCPQSIDLNVWKTATTLQTEKKNSDSLLGNENATYEQLFAQNKNLSEAIQAYNTAKSTYDQQQIENFKNANNFSIDSTNNIITNILPTLDWEALWKGISAVEKGIKHMEENRGFDVRWINTTALSQQRKRYNNYLLTKEQNDSIPRLNNYIAFLNEATPQTNPAEIQLNLWSGEECCKRLSEIYTSLGKTEELQELTTKWTSAQGKGEKLVSQFNTERNAYDNVDAFYETWRKVSSIGSFTDPEQRVARDNYEKAYKSAKETESDGIYDSKRSETIEDNYKKELNFLASPWKDLSGLPSLENITISNCDNFIGEGKPISEWFIGYSNLPEWAKKLLQEEYKTVSALSQKVQACQKEKEDLEKKLPGIKQTLQDALNKQIPSEIFSYEDMINIIKDTVRLASYYKTYDSTLKALYLSDTASFWSQVQLKLSQYRACLVKATDETVKVQVCDSLFKVDFSKFSYEDLLLHRDACALAVSLLPFSPFCSSEVKRVKDAYSWTPWVKQRIDERVRAYEKQMGEEKASQLRCQDFMNVIAWWVDQQGQPLDVTKVSFAQVQYGLGFYNTLTDGDKEKVRESLDRFVDGSKSLIERSTSWLTTFSATSWWELITAEQCQWMNASDIKKVLDAYTSALKKVGDDYKRLEDLIVEAEKIVTLLEKVSEVGEEIGKLNKEIQSARETLDVLWGRKTTLDKDKKDVNEVYDQAKTKEQQQKNIDDNTKLFRETLPIAQEKVGADTTGWGDAMIILSTAIKKIQENGGDVTGFQNQFNQVNSAFSTYLKNTNDEAEVLEKLFPGVKQHANDVDSLVANTPLPNTLSELSEVRTNFLSYMSLVDADSAYFGKMTLCYYNQLTGDGLWKIIQEAKQKGEKFLTQISQKKQAIKQQTQIDSTKSSQDRINDVIGRIDKLQLDSKDPIEWKDHIAPVWDAYTKLFDEEQVKVSSRDRLINVKRISDSWIQCAADFQRSWENSGEWLSFDKTTSTWRLNQEQILLEKYNFAWKVEYQLDCTEGGDTRLLIFYSETGENNQLLRSKFGELNITPLLEKMSLDDRYHFYNDSIPRVIDVVSDTYDKAVEKAQYDTSNLFIGETNIDILKEVKKDLEDLQDQYGESFQNFYNFVHSEKFEQLTEEQQKVLNLHYDLLVEFFGEDGESTQWNGGTMQEFIELLKLKIADIEKTPTSELDFDGGKVYYDFENGILHNLDPNKSYRLMRRDWGVDSKIIEGDSEGNFNLRQLWIKPGVYILYPSDGSSNWLKIFVTNNWDIQVENYDIMRDKEGLVNPNHQIVLSEIQAKQYDLQAYDIMESI